MVPTDISPAHLSEQPEEDLEQYRPVSGAAIAALIVGIVSLSAWIEPFLAAFAVAGVLIAFGAMWQIAANAPEMIGRKAALLGLSLSVFSLAGVAADRYTYRTAIRNEAEQFAQQWFGFVFKKQFHRAFDMTAAAAQTAEPLMVEGAMTMPPGGPQPPGHESYSRQTEVRALAAIGNRAQARYYQTEFQRPKEGGDELKQVYAVTFDDQGKKTTFFVRLTMERLIDAKLRKAQWKLLSSEAGVKPVALGGKMEG